MLTAAAMLVGKLLGGAAQYHELEAIDYETGEFVIASSGEFDLGFGAGEVPRLVRNGWFAADARCGACASFAGPAGPATLIGFAQVGDGYRLIAAEGELTGRAFPATGTANGGFRFTRGLEGWSAWCRAGANHHLRRRPGRLRRRSRRSGGWLGSRPSASEPAASAFGETNRTRRLEAVSWS